MKRLVGIVLGLVFLAGCNASEASLNRAMGLRAKLLGSSGCSFDTTISADYGDKTCTFQVSCQVDAAGTLLFTVKEPEVIAGVSGKIGGDGGELTFDDKALAFPLLADDQLTPVSAPWIFIKTLQGGYVKSCGVDGDMVRVSIDDSYEEDALRLDIWLGQDDLPVQAEILYRDRRILSLQIENFQIL